MTIALPEGYQFVAINESRKDDVMALDLWVFARGESVEDWPDERWPLEWDRTVGVVPARSQNAMNSTGEGPSEQAADLAAMYSTFTFTEFPIPGATLPVGGLTWVGVHPQHRRRGILRSLITDHFRTCLERGEAVSALGASEYSIYGRFGYGSASDEYELTIPRGAALRDVPGADQHTFRMETASAEKHADLVNQIHRAAGTPAGIVRPGWVTRETPGLQAEYWDDAPFVRDGQEPRRIVVMERNGEPRAYARFRRPNADWKNAMPVGTVSVTEAVAVDVAAARALWGVLLDLDLTEAVSVEFVPVDDALLHLLMDRRVAKPKVFDAAWVRILDLPAALAARQYTTDIDVVLDVSDELLPQNAGLWRLRAEAFGAASCERVEATGERVANSAEGDAATEHATATEPATADITLDIQQLGAAYLGGRSLAALAAAGLVQARTRDILARTATAFGWPLAPGQTWEF
ncbi:MAG: GNAT family N-acetyltransferase [Cellulomonadaceae bacterium]|jgi:predicted acetyltransferase|nr:GNAT family N-acetyltransferase [Cellulomonadaceae bacterium]